MARGYFSPELSEREPARRVESAPRELGPSWREEAVLANLILIGLGVVLAVAPFVIGSDPGANAWIDVAAGAAVVVLALIRVLGAHGAAWIGVLIGLIGVGMAAVALPLHERPAQERAALATAVVIALVAIWSAGAPARRRG